ncbi:MAG: hydroxyisourate hydrolase [Candidatus Marinimicrobia bacterium]|nr:hydroxyisourate hydrolase [Candidatus Neomarinimicrobiota bacterium]
MNSPLTTHVLDTAGGQPAAGVAVTLERQLPGGDWQTLGSGTTDSDGRIGSLMADETQVEPGVYRLNFNAGAYFAAQGTATLYGIIPIVFVIDKPQAHLHIPLLLSPYQYSTYRGS